MVWVIAFGELFFGDLWCVVWGYGGMRTHFSLLNPAAPSHSFRETHHRRKAQELNVPNLPVSNFSLI